MTDEVDDALRAGVAVYDAGHVHAAHDAWEDAWLTLPDGDDERLLHGLIQFVACVHHAENGNWEGVRGLAESGRGYLADLPDAYRDVNVATVRQYLATVAADPEHVERVAPPPLRYEGASLEPADLDLGAALRAAVPLAEALGYDADAVERAVEYARDDLAAGEEGSAFVTFLLDFVRDADHRGTVAARLTERTARRRSRVEDVDGLF
ncbi:MAG: DUF309 domain-containing protein [Haloarculaceae archaeon]